ncbi:lantibiotic dehydratase [Lentzea sp. NPDC060358]|uniref:lantibiotic dehydratase n=1 Tax=Lentzea sp. NPDC060358 TaxID=3347103 RepID=UPI00364A2E01
MDVRFRSSDRFLLRAPVLPRRRLGSAVTAVDDALDPLLREAVAVASPALTAALDKVLAGRAPATGRLLAALTRYELRMAGRPTPFGLLAGVAVGEFAERAEAWLDGAHRRHVHLDQAWLDRWAGELEADLDVLVRLEVTANNLCTRHGDRLTVPHGTRLVGVRRTAVVARLLAAAATRIPVRDLVDVVAGDFPDVRRSALPALVAELVRLRFLQTSLRQSERPLERVIELLPARYPQWERAAATKASVDAYRRSPVGRGTAELTAVRRTAGADDPVRVDLELDAHVRLPHEVAREAERAADVLWRLSAHDNARSRNLADFHVRFLERYGVGELVPVLDLLDRDAGIGPPAGYERPWEAAPADDSRHPVLVRLLAGALADGVTEVVLDDDLVDRLCPPGGTPPATAELFVTLHAASVDALERGCFELVVNPLTGTQQAGASLGRFGHLPQVRDLLAELAAVQADDRIPVQLDHLTTDPRDANVARVPRVLAHSLAVGVPGRPGGLDLADVAVAADAHRLRLYSVSLGREIVPRVLHVLDISAAAPEVVRFLWDVSLMGVRTLKPWDWSALRDSPFLPAVRSGRTVLTPARWRVGESDVDTDGALAAWRRKWWVPGRVRLTNLDQQLCLDLGVREHRALLRAELRKSGTAVVCEDRSPALDQGWLRGPEGVHEVELVVPLVAADPERRPVRPPAPVRRSVAHLPGGDWVSAHVQCSPHRQREVLLAHLNPWLATVKSEVDRWFFVRYQADEQPPHIRLRLHGDVLPQVRDRVAALVDARLCAGFSVHAYRPEVERYGGEAVIDLAERVFAADSRVALRGTSAAPDTLAVAADVVSLISCFHGPGQDWPAWLLAEVPKDEAAHRAFARRRSEALAAITLDPVPADGDWAELLGEYGAKVRAAAADWTSPGEILRALLHLPCNRRLGADFRAEAEVCALARGAVKAHLDRRRAAR